MKKYLVIALAIATMVTAVWATTLTNPTPGTGSTSADIVGSGTLSTFDESGENMTEEGNAQDCYSDDATDADNDGIYEEIHMDIDETADNETNPLVLNCGGSYNVDCYLVGMRMCDPGQPSNGWCYEYAGIESLGMEWVGVVEYYKWRMTLITFCHCEDEHGNEYRTYERHTYIVYTPVGGPVPGLPQVEGFGWEEPSEEGDITIEQSRLVGTTSGT